MASLEKSVIGFIWLAIPDLSVHHCGWMLRQELRQLVT